jgi:hypothetical protein
LPSFTFQQVDVNHIEFRALPGSEARTLRAKIMRQHSFSGLGGQAVLSPGKGLIRCRGARPGARWARLFLRKPDRISGWISFPADAFSAQRPSFRATSLLFRKKERTKVKGGKGDLWQCMGKRSSAGLRPVCGSILVDIWVSKRYRNPVFPLI